MHIDLFLLEFPAFIAILVFEGVLPKQNLLKPQPIDVPQNNKTSRTKNNIVLELERVLLLNFIIK